jgi:hypothetical protein
MYFWHTNGILKLWRSETRAASVMDPGKLNEWASDLWDGVRHFTWLQHPASGRHEDAHIMTSSLFTVGCTRWHSTQHYGFSSGYSTNIQHSGGCWHRCVSDVCLLHLSAVAQVVVTLHRNSCKHLEPTYPSGPGDRVSHRTSVWLSSVPLGQHLKLGHDRLFPNPSTTHWAYHRIYDNESNRNHRYINQEQPTARQFGINRMQLHPAARARACASQSSAASM